MGIAVFGTAFGLPLSVFGGLLGAFTAVVFSLGAWFRGLFF